MISSANLVIFLLRISEILAISAIICSFIPNNYDIAFAMSRSHIGLPVREFLPLVFLFVAGILSAIALGISYGRLISYGKLTM